MHYTWEDPRGYQLRGGQIKEHEGYNYGERSRQTNYNDRRLRGDLPRLLIIVSYELSSPTGRPTVRPI